MRYAYSLAFLLAPLMAASADAGDSHVPQSTLAAVGLADMQMLTDAEGAEVRGLSGNAAARGLSLVSGLLIDPATNSFVFGSDVNATMANAENAGLQVFTMANTFQNSAIALDLNVITGVSFYNGILFGAAGGNAFASSQ